MKPILMSTEMVKAILEGRKTVTRRLIKPHNSRKAKYCKYSQGEGLWFDNEINEWDKDTHIKDYSISPCWIGTTIYIQKFAPYQPDDVLYVRETWCEAMGRAGLFFYRAYAGPRDEMKEYCHRLNSWRPSIHMPKEAARIFLRVKGVRVERLQDITLDDAIAEGCQGKFIGSGECVGAGWEIFPEDEFANVWDGTIKKADLAKYGWDANPWVWVIEFERISREEAMKDA